MLTHNNWLFVARPCKDLNRVTSDMIPFPPPLELQIYWTAKHFSAKVLFVVVILAVVLDSKTIHAVLWKRLCITWCPSVKFVPNRTQTGNSDNLRNNAHNIMALICSSWQYTLTSYYNKSVWYLMLHLVKVKLIATDLSLWLPNTAFN